MLYFTRSLLLMEATQRKRQMEPAASVFKEILLTETWLWQHNGKANKNQHWLDIFHAGHHWHI